MINLDNYFTDNVKDDILINNYNILMENKINNQNCERAKNWFDQGEGFMEAFILVYNEWDVWQRRVNFNYKILIIPQQFLFIHSVECFLKSFLVSKGVSNEEIKNYKHNLKKLRIKCSEYDSNFFEDEDIKYIDYAAGSKQKYAEQKYPEGSKKSSFHDLIILKKLVEYIYINVYN